jgi:carbamoylphosphate synthase large subunit
MAGASRYVSAHSSVSPALWSTRSGMLAAVAEAVDRHRVDVVLPVTDAASRVLLGEQGLVGCAIAGPAPEAYARASDKAGLMESAQACELRVPVEYALRSPEDLPGLPVRLGAYVVKPSRSVVEVNGGSVSLSVRFVASSANLPSAISKYPDAAYPLLVQERIFGSGIGVFLLRRDRTTLLQFGHLRLREKPPAGGVSTYREAVEPPAELVQRCERLLDLLGYEGPAMIEFKLDRHTGEAVLMEINARLWGSVQLAIDAGVDFPAVLIASTLGLPIPPRPVVRHGVRTFWELGEVDHALALLRRSAEQLSAPPGMQVGGRAAIRALLDHRWKDRPEVFRLDDPFPFFVEFARWLRRL